MLEHDHYIGEIRFFAFPFPPKGWAACDGQSLLVREHQALASVLGGHFGEDGKVKFRLPDLRGRTPVGAHGGGGAAYALGSAAGADQAALALATMPAHSHRVAVQDADGSQLTPLKGFPANAKEADGKPKINVYGPPAAKPTTFHPSAIGTTGSGEAFSIRQPCLAGLYCIALTGEYPPRAD